MAFVLNIGIVLSFFLGILLFSKKDKVLTDNILSIWLIAIGIHLTGYFLYPRRVLGDLSTPNWNYCTFPAFIRPIFIPLCFIFH